MAIADATANLEKAKEIQTQEAVTTAKETEISNRVKALALIKALQVAEEEAIAKKTLALAEKEASMDRAEAVKIIAEGKAEAIKINAEAMQKEYEVEAEGKKLINDAMNTLSSEQIKKEIQLSMIDRLPDIIEQMIKPANNIDSIKIVDMGEGGRNFVQNSTEGESQTKASLPEQITNAMMNYSVGNAMINDMLKESGLAETAGIKELKDFLKSNDIAKPNVAYTNITQESE